MRGSYPLLAALLAVTVAAGCGKEAKNAKAAPPPVSVEVLVLAPTELRDTGDYLGSLLSRGSVTVLPQVAGYVRKIQVKPGASVAAGAPLVEIDSREEAAALTSAAAQAESAKASLALAKQTLTRTEGMFREGLVSAQDLDKAQADKAAAEAAVRAATAQVSQRRVAMSNRQVAAPVAGVVGDVQVRVGDYVTATTPLTTLSKSKALELSVAVPASRARGVAPGVPVEILADDGSVLVASTAFFIASDADPKTQLVEIKASFDNTVGLRPEELVRARVVYQKRAALQVPLTAVARQSGQAFVFVVVEEGGQTKVQRRPIKLGSLGERGYLVEDGLAAGDRIAVSALQQLRDGAAVTIVGPQKGS
jgi:RND family efflux transporter MFP subunit